MVMAYSGESRWSTTAMSMTVAFISASAIISLYFARRKSRELDSKVLELEASLAASLKKCAAERQGRIRAQQALRKALADPKSDTVECSYPMTPIGVIQSSFSTRNGTPRQSLLVPLARARLVFNSSRIPPVSIEGLGEYSHCWIIYVFHLNTDLEKLWKNPSNSKFKAKVRVPRLKGERIGVFATRSPHRPCPIGLTIAKVEAIQGHEILLSGGDLVDGTPVLDVKPYLPYCDSIHDATVPKWLMGESLLSVASVCFSEEFASTLADCWPLVEKKSLYASADELKDFVKQVLSWDIRSVAQRGRSHGSHVKMEHETMGVSSDSEGQVQVDDAVSGRAPVSSGCIIYHLLVDGLDVSYMIGCRGDVVVCSVELAPSSSRTESNQRRAITSG